MFAFSEREMGQFALARSAASTKSHCATRGTAAWLHQQGIAVEQANKVGEDRPDIVDRMKNGEIVLVFNTTHGKQAIADSFSIRRTALMSRIPYFTTAAGMRAAVAAMEAVRTFGFHCKALQDYLPGKGVQI